MRRLVVLMMLWAGVASAQTKTFYVDAQNGSDSNNGRSAATAWRLIATANTRTGPGQIAASDLASDSNVVILIVAGTITNQYGYDAFPHPQSNAASGKRYYYYLYGLMPEPGDALTNGTTFAYMPGGTVTRDFISYRGLHFTSTLSLVGADYDSVMQCVMDGLTMEACRFTTIDDFNNYSTSAFTFNDGGTPAGQIRSCTINNGRILQLEGSDIIKMRYCYATTFSRLRVKQVQPATTNGAQFIYADHDSGMTWAYNLWQFDNAALLGGGSAPERCLFMRDSTVYFSWNSDTLFQTATGTHTLNNQGRIMASASGSSPNTCHHYTWDSLYIKLEHSDFGIWFQNGITNFTMTYSTVISEDGLALAPTQYYKGDVLIDHNTFVSWNYGRTPEGNRKSDDQHSTVNFLESLISMASTDSLQFTNNIVANMTPRDSGQVFYGQTGNTTYPLQDTFTGNVERIISDWNLYWNKVFNEAPGDKAIGNGGNGEWSLADYQADFPTRDQRSKWGSPVFWDSLGGNDSTFLDFTDNIGSLSWARARGKDATDIGSKAFSAPRFLINRTFSLIDGDSAGTYTDSINVYNVGTSGTLTLSVSVYPVNAGCTVSLTSSALAVGAVGQVVVTVVGPSSRPEQWRVTIRTNDGRTPQYSFPVFWQGGPTQDRFVADPPGGGGKSIMEP